MAIHNEHLSAAMDLATQAKFSYYYGGTPGYSDGDVLYEVLEYFGVIITQSSADVTLTLPTSGFSVGSRNYLRQITSRYGSGHPVTINLDGSNSRQRKRTGPNRKPHCQVLHVDQRV